MTGGTGTAIVASHHVPAERRWRTQRFAHASPILGRRQWLEELPISFLKRWLGVALQSNEGSLAGIAIADFDQADGYVSLLLLLLLPAAASRLRRARAGVFASRARTVMRCSAATPYWQLPDAMACRPIRRA